MSEWWGRIPDHVKVFAALIAVGSGGVGIGLRADTITQTPRLASENRVLLQSIDSVLARHRALPAHPEEARARIAGDSMLLRAVLRGDSLILATLRWTVCVERLDRREPSAGPARLASECPPPGTIDP